MITQTEIDEHRLSCEAVFEDVPKGPWTGEPHRVEFEHVGLPCILSRNFSLLNWCGYVGVPPGHPLHGKSYNEAHDRAHLDVHGGLTFGNSCHPPICHVPKPGQPDNVWWFGFDCAHGGDLVPGFIPLEKQIGRPMSFAREGAYRDVAYVTAETKRLAEQLAQ